MTTMKVIIHDINGETVFDIDIGFKELILSLLKRMELQELEQ